jgi:hypothetical protein
LGAALAAAPASAAHAQFGRLVKRAAEAAAGAAAGAAGDRAAGAAAERAGVPAPGGRARDASALEITGERLDAFAAAMRGPVAAAERRAAQQAAYEAAHKAWEAASADGRAKHKAYDACKDRMTDGRTPDLSPATMQRLEPLVRRFTDVNVRHGQAAAAGNARLAAVLADSSEALQLAMAEVQFPGFLAQCGRPPRPVPAEPAAPPAADEAALRPVVPAGMTPLQFGVLRERVGAWLVNNGRGAALSDAERQALESRRSALAPFTGFYNGDRLEWVNVGARLDVKD